MRHGILNLYDGRNHNAGCSIATEYVAEGASGVRPQESRYAASHKDRLRVRLDRGRDRGGSPEADRATQATESL